jgi:calcineurin-like phosphoesterase family protein
MNTFFISDTHFGHANLMKHYPDRNRFGTVEELDEWMIQEWNKKIGKKDKVYHIGDFGSFNVEHSTRVVRRLNGSKELVPGNHDKKHIKTDAFAREWAAIHPYSYKEISVEGQQIVLSHFPIWEWMQIHRGWWHVHGHVHGKPTGIPGKIIDAGVDGSGLLPRSFEEVKAYMDARELRTHHNEIKEDAYVER